MIIKINLLPPHVKDSQRKIKKIKLNFKTLVKVLLIFIIIEISLGVLKGAIKFKIKKINKERKRLAPLLGQIQSINRELRKIEEKISILNSVKKRNFCISLFFDKLLKILPKTIWFSKVIITQENIFIEGSSVSLGKFDQTYYVNELVERIRDCFKDIVQDVELKSLRKRNISKTEIADFSIWIRLKSEN